MATPSDDQLRWRHYAAIAKHEILCAAIIVADVLDRRDAGEPDWQRLVLALQRLRALAESE
ncbi:MAG TPA: hypothetical protein VGD45_27760 [Steroidobacter sp.]|uniref:hypothetical protein n=1 Tax=Steroidobacter sp. TaxID=1978227 RepID=UPI002ED9168B